MKLSYNVSIKEYYKKVMNVVMTKYLQYRFTSFFSCSYPNVVAISYYNIIPPPKKTVTKCFLIEKKIALQNGVGADLIDKSLKTKYSE